MKKIALICALLLSFDASAGGWTNWAVPTQIDVERGGGFMVYGSFGNPNTCTISDRIYVQISHPQYDEIYSLVLAAIAAQQEIRLYCHTCQPVPWYSVPATTYNHVTSGGAVNVRTP